MSTKNQLDVDEMLRVVLKAGHENKQASFVETHLRLLIGAAREIFVKESNLLEVNAPVHIFGDIHGQFSDLLRHFEKIGAPDADVDVSYNYLFLGDYVDRGQYSLETIIFLMCYKLKYPDRLFLLRGNHECGSINRIYGFYDECKRRYNIKLWKLFTDCFNCLPIAAVVQNTIFCVHGGLSPNFNNFDQIRSMVRPMDIPDHGLAADLLWSDPDEDITGWGENDRGVSWTFGGDIVLKFLQDTNCGLVARAHQVVEDGYQFFQKRKLVTLFSASNYCGEFDNAGAVMSVNADLLCTFSILKPESMQPAIKTNKKK